MVPLVADRFTAALGLARRSGVSIPLPTPRSPPLNDDEGVTGALSLAPALALVGVTIDNDLDLSCAEDDGEDRGNGFQDVPPSETGKSSGIVLPTYDDAGLGKLRETRVEFKLPDLGGNFLDRGWNECRDEFNRWNWVDRQKTHTRFLSKWNRWRRTLSTFNHFSIGSRLLGNVATQVGKAESHRCIQCSDNSGLDVKG